MKRKLCFITCLLLGLMLLSACHIGKDLVAQPVVTPAATPFAETAVQTPASTPLPTPVPTPVPAPTHPPEPTPPPFTPTPVPGPAVVITKNPSSESLAIGGKTWFIAHAENAYSLTWELVDPYGNVHSVSDAMAQNPGLLLEVLEGDTIAFSNVPLSLNGWGIQARFDGQGNSATTSPAYIYVGDFINAYSSVIEKYRIAKQANIRGAGNASNYGVSETISYYDHIGYALKDLDKNGIPELIIAGTGQQYYNPVLCEVHTLVNNTPKKLFTSWARIRYYLMRDNRILNEGSGGAADTIVELFKLNGDHLEFIEGYRTVNEYDSSGMNIYYSSAWNGETEEFTVRGDYSHPDATYSRDEFPNLYDLYKPDCWIPPLTIIA